VPEHLHRILPLVRTLSYLAFVWVFKVVAGRGEEVAFGKIFPKFSNLVAIDRAIGKAHHLNPSLSLSSNLAGFTNSPVPRCENVLGHVSFAQSQPMILVVAVLATHLAIKTVEPFEVWWGTTSRGGGRARSEPQFPASWTRLFRGWLLLLVFGRGAKRLQGGHRPWLFPPELLLDGWTFLFHFLPWACRSAPGPCQFCLSVDDCVLIFVNLGGKSLLARLAGMGSAAVPLSVVAVQTP